MANPTESSSLLPRKKNDEKVSKEKLRASVAAIGGSGGLGKFQVQEQPDVQGLPRSYSITAAGEPASLTPAELGRQELYEQIPFTAVFGLQKKERAVSMAFADFAAEMDLTSAVGLSDSEKDMRKSRMSMVIMDEIGIEAAVVTTPLVFAVITASLCQFLVGYNTSVLNAPEPVIFPGHSTGIWSLAVAAFAIGAPFGAILAGQIVETRGRRGALLIDMWIFFCGGLLQTIAPNMIVIIISRFIVGFASGCSSVLVPIYLGEISPPTLRGTFGTLASFFVVIGILVADVVAFPFTTESLWRVMTAITSVTAALQLFASGYLPESPRWLLAKEGPDSLKARENIKKLRGLRHHDDIEAEVGYFLIGGDAQKQEDSSQSAVLGEIFASPRRRSMFWACIVLQMAQQFCGINAVFFYSTSFFEGVIDNPQVGTTIVGAVNVVATYAALLLMDRCTRKALLLWSAGGMFWSCIIIVASLLGIFSNVFALIAVNIYVSFFEIGMGPIPWLIAPEFFEGKYVAVVMSICAQVNYTCSFLVGLGFPFMVKYLGPYSFGPFAVVLLGTFVFTLVGLPDAEGESVDDIKEDIVKRKSQSVVYQPNSTNAGLLDDEWRKAMEQLMEEEELGDAKTPLVYASS